VIDAAIYDLSLSVSSATEPVDEHAFDPELWARVKREVEEEEWDKIPALVEVFVEDHIRAWAGDPRGRDGQTLFGKGLFGTVLADDSEYRLGDEKGEWEGWRALGVVGFTQAISNVDRHNVRDRAYARRYAIGVLGLGSLLLSQMRHQHAERLHARSVSGQ
jgi:Protein of unknown function (Hypoth_ymh)